MFHKALAAIRPISVLLKTVLYHRVGCQLGAKSDNALVIALPGQAIALQPAKPLRVEIAHKLGRFRHLTSLSKIARLSRTSEL
jgi:hypothetical protein